MPGTFTRCSTHYRVIRDLTVSNLSGVGDGSGFGEHLFWNHRRTIHLIKRMASTMLSAVIKRQYSSVSFVMSLFASFWRNLWNGDDFCTFIVRVTLIKTANRPTSLHKPATLVLTVIN